MNTELNMDTLRIGTREFRSRLMLGTGKYRSFEEMQACLEASGAEIITVALRRLDLSNPQQPGLLDYIDLNRYTILPNTAGCFSAEDAVRHARLARELLANLGNPGQTGSSWNASATRARCCPIPSPRCKRPNSW